MKFAAKRSDRPRSLRFECYEEGCCLQTLHGGRYDDETPNLGVTFNGAHHEIDLSDPRRTEPARPKTVLRQPVRPI